jgi:hypothetical protein
MLWSSLLSETIEIILVSSSLKQQKEEVKEQTSTTPERSINTTRATDQKRIDDQELLLDDHPLRTLGDGGRCRAAHGLTTAGKKI